MTEKTKVEVLVRYREVGSDEIKYSFIENTDYETALRKFLMMKGGKKKISIISIRDYDRREQAFTSDKAITIDDKDGIVYKVMNE